MTITINEDECRKAKETLRKNNANNMVWRNRFAPSRFIGNCSRLYHMHDPLNYADFLNKYLLYSNEYRYSLNVAERGLTEDELIALAWRYKEECEARTGEEHGVETYLNDALCHIIVETFDGMGKERNFKNYLISKGYRILRDDSYDDTVMGIDIKAENGYRKLYIQIKPLSFFTAERPDTQRDRVSLVRKHEKTLEKYGVETLYAIYDYRTGNWVMNGNGYCHRIGDLFSYDKEDIDTTFERIRFYGKELKYGQLN